MYLVHCNMSKYRLGENGPVYIVLSEAMIREVYLGCKRIKIRIREIYCVDVKFTHVRMHFRM